MDTFCVLGDCSKNECHHCFPVKNCSLKHEWCKEKGCCEEIFMEKRILITGCAGFIGSHLAIFLLDKGYTIYGIDNINNYYDIKIKNNNLSLLKTYKRFIFYKEDIIDTKIISEIKPYKIIHLASMAGVRYSIENPLMYSNININGFINILQESVKNNVKAIIYASSSSVYGLNKKVPFSEDDKIETCNSPYAVSKMSMELFAKTYSQLYNLSCIGLRFFTVYGPRGRPDMAPYKFMKAIMDGTEFNKYGNGESSRDYTYISDIVNGIYGALLNKNNVLCEVYNLGNSTPISLNDFIKIIEKITKKKAKFKQIEEQLGDVPHTYAEITKAKRDLNYNPEVKLEVGLKYLYEYLKKKIK